MKVSVILPVYNVEKYLRRCLDSVTAQTVLAADDAVSVECILVDDCGSDGSMQLARDYVEEYHGPVEWRFTAHTRNRGLAAARNTGLDIATGDYILFLDSDDELLPRSLEALLATAALHPGVDMVQGNAVVDTKELIAVTLDEREVPDFCNDREWIRDKMYLNNPGTAWNKLMRHDFIRSHNLRFKEGLIHEDDHWTLQLVQHLGSIAWCRERTYHYVSNDQGIMQQKMLDRHYASLVEIYREFLPIMTDAKMRQHVMLTLSRRLGDKKHLKNPAAFRNQLMEMADAMRADSRVPRYIKTAFLYMKYHFWPMKMAARFYDSRLYCLMILMDRARSGRFKVS